MLIPISGKPGDLDTSQIETAGDADRVLCWLGAVLKDMATQVADRGDKADAEWLRKLRAAQRATTNLFHRVLEKRDALTETRSLPEAFMAAVLEMKEPAVLAQIQRWIDAHSPHLSGLDLDAAKYRPD